MDSVEKMDLRMPAQNVSSIKTDLRSLGAKSNNGKTNVEKIAQEFESYLMFTMLKELEKTANLTKKGHTEQTYMSLVYEKAADFMAKKGIGIKEMLVEHMEKNTKVLSTNGDNIAKLKKEEFHEDNQ